MQDGLFHYETNQFKGNIMPSLFLITRKPKPKTNKQKKPQKLTKFTESFILFSSLLPTIEVTVETQ